MKYAITASWKPAWQKKSGSVCTVCGGSIQRGGSVMIGFVRWKLFVTTMRVHLDCYKSEQLRRVDEWFINHPNGNKAQTLEARKELDRCYHRLRYYREKKFLPDGDERMVETLARIDVIRSIGVVDEIKTVDGDEEWQTFMTQAEEKRKQSEKLNALEKLDL